MITKQTYLISVSFLFAVSGHRATKGENDHINVFKRSSSEPKESGKNNHFLGKEMKDLIYNYQSNKMVNYISNDVSSVNV